LQEDSTGLRFENDVPDVSYARDAQMSMQRGDLTQCSFGFTVSPKGDTYRKDPEIENGYIREIRSVAKLFDVSIVTYPAYLDTSCAVRSIISNMKAEEEAVIKAVKEQEEAERQRTLSLKRKRLELAQLLA
jgi:phage head maturation protease